MPQHTPVSPPGGGTASAYRPALFSMGAGYEAPAAACASCPASLWYRDDQLRCFCNIIKMPTWPASTAVMACDGRESAVAQWEEQQR